MKQTIAIALVITSCVAPCVAAAGGSNQVRPIPSPITGDLLSKGQLMLTPGVALARYKNSLNVPGLTETTGVKQEYEIFSTGLTVKAAYGLTRWLSVDTMLEGYRKFGTITGPSPGDPSMLTEAHVLGWAFKIGGQGTARLYGSFDDAFKARPGAFALYVFARALFDLFRQTQREPLYATDFAENAFTYRAGAAATFYLGYGITLAPFAGVEGYLFGGQRQDQAASAAAATTKDISGNAVYPFFGGDILFNPKLTGELGGAVSLGAILALAAQDDYGLGGPLFTLTLNYTFHFGGPAPPPKQRETPTSTIAPPLIPTTGPKSK